MTRHPYVSNQFYPGDKDLLKATVEEYLKTWSGVAESAIAILSPHAGYIYSGMVAGLVYSAVKIPDNVILIGPNHTGLGERAAIMDKGKWEMPFGSANIDEELSHLILDSSSIFTADSTAHLREHSLEVQLPFIYSRNPNAKIVPITVMTFGYGECETLGKGIASAIKTYKKTTLIVVSSDMNHYESEKITKKKDSIALDKITSLDAEGLLDATRTHDITMCGVIAAVIAITASKILGAKEATVVAHSTSGDVSGDYSHVVGYAGVIIK